MFLKTFGYENRKKSIFLHEATRRYVGIALGKFDGGESAVEPSVSESRNTGILHSGSHHIHFLYYVVYLRHV